MSQLTKQQAEQAVAKYGSERKAAEALKVSRHALHDARANQSAPRGVAEQKPAMRTLADFRREHDQTWKIRDGLRRLFTGGVIMTDAEFRNAVNGNATRWRSAADAAEFRENRYRVSGEMNWGSKETIREMRKIRGEAV